MRYHTLKFPGPQNRHTRVWRFGGPRNFSVRYLKLRLRVWQFGHTRRLSVRYLTLSLRVWPNCHTRSLSLRYLTLKFLGPPNRHTRVWRFWGPGNFSVWYLTLKFFHFKDLAGVVRHTQIFG